MFPLVVNHLVIQANPQLPLCPVVRVPLCYNIPWVALLLLFWYRLLYNSFKDQKNCSFYASCFDPNLDFKMRIPSLTRVPGI